MALNPARTMPGVLELLPLDQIAFQRMLDVIRRNYERFGFLPIETPVIEYSDVLLTKTGGETERQVYFVQSTGALGKSDEGMPELALRFDLTVPLARYVAEHERAVVHRCTLSAAHEHGLFVAPTVIALPRAAALTRRSLAGALDRQETDEDRHCSRDDDTGSRRGVRRPAVK